MDVDLTWSDAARQAALAARQAKAQGRAAQKRNKPQGAAVAPAGQKLPKLNDRQRAKVTLRDEQGNGRITNKRAGQAIAAFQKRHGLAVTGELNPATRKLAAHVAKTSTKHHFLAKAVHQIGRAKNGENWKQNERRAANLIEKHDKRQIKLRKLKADLSNDGKFTPDTIDLGKDGSKWKHGYIPLNAQAVALKAHKSPGGGSEVKGVGHPGEHMNVIRDHVAKVGDSGTTPMHVGPEGRGYVSKHSGTHTVHHVIGSSETGDLRVEKHTVADAEKAAVHLHRHLYGAPKDNSEKTAWREHPRSSAAPGDISNADKIKNAEKMYGTNSPQHLAAKKRFGAKKGSFYHGPKSRNSSN